MCLGQRRATWRFPPGCVRQDKTANQDSWEACTERSRSVGVGICNKPAIRFCLYQLYMTKKVGTDTYLSLSVSCAIASNYGARALPRSRLPIVLAVIFIWVMGLAGTTVL
jgi:hypothetical protein